MQISSLFNWQISFSRIPEYNPINGIQNLLRRGLAVPTSEYPRSSSLHPL